MLLFVLILGALFAGAQIYGGVPLAPAPDNETRAAASSDAAEDEIASRGGSGEIYVRTRRRGVHHVVEVEMTGPSGVPVTLDMMLDTGATLVALPQSLMEELGFDAADLTPGRAQTASGVVRTLRGFLNRMEVNGNGAIASLNDVEVAFIPDAKIGDQALLGMSFLGGFRLMIDDRNSEIVLIERD